MNWQHLFEQVIATAIFGLLGILIFGVAIKLIQKFLPFSITKEIETDQNVALAVLMGSVLLGLAIIVAAAIH